MPPSTEAIHAILDGACQDQDIVHVIIQHLLLVPKRLIGL